MNDISTIPTSDLPTIDLAVGGMTCASCAATIQRGLGHLDGVASAEVNIATRRARVRPDGSLEPEELEGAMRAVIAGLGYQVLTPQRPAADQDAHGQDGASHHDPGPHHQDREHEGHQHVQADTARLADYGRRLAVAVILTVPLLPLSMVMAWQFAGWEWVALALATPVIFWAGWPFHRSTLMSARHGAVTMDTLVTLGTSAAWAWSTAVLVGGALGVPALADGHVYFETGAVITALILLGKWLEVRGSLRAGDALRALGRVQARTARLEDGSEIDRDALQVGMRFVVRPGEAIATDGVVVEGEAAVDSSLVTGESVPVAVSVGDTVVGGTVSTDGALTVEATQVGEQTMVAQIARMVDEAQSNRTRVQRLADRISAVFVPVVVLIALATLAAWWASGDVDKGFTTAVAVLIISCPCALGLATPLAIMVGTGRGAQLGMIIRGGDVLEDTRRITTVVMDKTGTLTEGRMTVVEAHAPNAADGDLLLDAAASVEALSEHPIAQAIATWREGRLPVAGFRSHAGRGASATVRGAGAARGKSGAAVGADGQADAEVRVGSRRLFDAVPPELEELARRAEQEGGTAVFAGRGPVLDGKSGALAVRADVAAEAVIVVRDTVKPTAASAVDALRALRLDVVLLTGDNERAASAVAGELGIDRVVAEVLPEDKEREVQRLREGGARVAMVGDGINDAPALARADLGIAMGTGTDVAREASDITIVSGDPLAVASAIRLSRRTLGVIRGNLFWAFAYNVAAIPLAALGVLNPMIAAAAMGSSSLFVVGNSLRLRGFTPRR